MLLNRILKTETRVKPDLVKATAILADNVADYFYRTNPQEYWDLEADFPNIAPPWPTIWFEWQVPRYINSDKVGFHENLEWKEFSRMGVLMISHLLTETRPDILQRHRESWVKQLLFFTQTMSIEKGGGYLPDHERKIRSFVERHYREAARDPIILATLEAVREKEMARLASRGGKWIFSARVFIEERNGRVIEQPAFVQGYVRGDGRFLGMDNEGKNLIVSPEKYVPPEVRQEWANAQSKYLHVPFMTLCFCHCKNVDVLEVNLPEGKNSRKKAAKQKAAYRFHVLNIEPMKQTLKHEGKAETHGLKKALHICRGHFATYSDDAPLFGKYVGTFWKPMHVRGDSKKGVVAKDYSVKL